MSPPAVPDSRHAVPIADRAAVGESGVRTRGVRLDAVGHRIPSQGCAATSGGIVAAAGDRSPDTSGTRPASDDRHLGHPVGVADDAERDTSEPRLAVVGAATRRQRMSGLVDASCSRMWPPLAAVIATLCTSITGPTAERDDPVASGHARFPALPPPHRRARIGTDPGGTRRGGSPLHGAGR